MKFFIPYAGDGPDAERLWSSTRADLRKLGFPTTGRRIWALSFDPAKPEALLHIGCEVFEEYGPALIILEAADIDIYYVCTPFNGVLGGDPFPMGLTDRGRAIDFAETIEGHA